MGDSVESLAEVEVDPLPSPHLPSLSCLNIS